MTTEAVLVVVALCATAMGFLAAGMIDGAVGLWAWWRWRERKEADATGAGPSSRVQGVAPWQGQPRRPARGGLTLATACKGQLT